MSIQETKSAETILFTYTRPASGTEPRTFSDDEIAAWYAVAKSITDEVYRQAQQEAQHA